MWKMHTNFEESEWLPVNLAYIYHDPFPSTSHLRNLSQSLILISPSSGRLGLPSGRFRRHFLKPWSRVPLEKLTGSQLVKEFPAYYGTRCFISAFTSAIYLSLFWDFEDVFLPKSCT